jgi:protein-tyrosine phosphatase
MASALFTARIQNHTDAVEVSSAGLRAAEGSVPEEVVEVIGEYGIDLGGHESRVLTPSILQGADLVIGMSRRHMQEAVLLDPPSRPHAFMFKELVRRGSLIGPRRPDQGFRSWIEAAHGDRTRESLLDRSGTDEVADPYGGSLADYRATAVELSGLTDQLIRLLWPEEPDGSPV